jgi:hypothetical protein
MGRKVEHGHFSSVLFLGREGRGHSMLPPQLPRNKTSFRTTAQISCAVASDSLRFSYSVGRQQRRRIHQHGKGGTSIIDQHNLPCRGSVERLTLLFRPTLTRNSPSRNLKCLPVTCLILPRRSSRCLDP